MVFSGCVLQEDNSANESSSSSWQWPWAASGEVNMRNPLLSAMADVVAGLVLDDMVSEVDMGRVALTCHFSLDVLCSEMHQPHVFLLQVLSLDVLIPVNEVRKACGIPCAVVLWREEGWGHGWVLFHDWRADPQFGGRGLQSGFGASFGGGFFHWRLLGGSFAGMSRW